MHLLKIPTGARLWVLTLALPALLSACGGGGGAGRDPVLGTGGATITIPVTPPAPPAPPAPPIPPAPGEPLPTTDPMAQIASFALLGGSTGLSNQGMLSVINGNVGTTAASTAVTGFHDPGAGCTYSETAGVDEGSVTALIYTAPPQPTVGCPSEGTAATQATATQAIAAAQAVYNTLAALPQGSIVPPDNLGNQVLAPGVYKAPSGSFVVSGPDLTLDAQGDANAVWVFQMSGSLTFGGPDSDSLPPSVILINGAQAKNVFWQVGTDVTVIYGGGATVVGTIIANDGGTLAGGTGPGLPWTLNGRMLSLTGAVTMRDTVINLPAP